MSERTHLAELRERAERTGASKSYPYNEYVSLSPATVLALVEAVEALKDIADRAEPAQSTEDISDVWRTFRRINDVRDGILARFDFGGAA